MTKVKDNRIIKYIVTWRSKSAPVRKKASFENYKIAESFYQEKLEEGKSPALYVTELVESTRFLYDSFSIHSCNCERNKEYE